MHERHIHIVIVICEIRQYHLHFYRASYPTALLCCHRVSVCPSARSRSSTKLAII